MPSDRDLKAALVADIEQIEDNAALFLAGRNSAYQAVAIQLRTLLLGGRSGLLVRTIPEASLHPVREDPPPVPPEPGLIQVTILGHVNYFPPWRGAAAHFTLPIDRERDPLSVEQWLNQWVVQPGMVIRNLIYETANEEVAHTKDTRGELLAGVTGAGVVNVSAEEFALGRLDRGEVVRESTRWPSSLSAST